MTVVRAVLTITANGWTRALALRHEENPEDLVATAAEALAFCASEATRMLCDDRLEPYLETLGKWPGDARAP